MKAINLKKIATAGAISGALGFAALGLGAGTASADDDSLVTPGTPSAVGDLETIIPILTDLAAQGKLTDPQTLNELGSMAGIGDLGSLSTLGTTGEFGDVGSLQDIAQYGEIVNALPIDALIRAFD